MEVSNLYTSTNSVNLQYKIYSDDATYGNYKVCYFCLSNNNISIHSIGRYSPTSDHLGNRVSYIWWDWALQELRRFTFLTDRLPTTFHGKCQTFQVRSAPWPRFQRKKSKVLAYPQSHHFEIWRLVVSQDSSLTWTVPHNRFWTLLHWDMG